MAQMTPRQDNRPYSEYLRFYPDKWAAISALRCSTGMGFSQANQTIEDLFGLSHAEECRIADAEHEEIYQAQIAAEVSAKRVGRKTGLAAAAGLLVSLGTIFDLSKKYK